MSELMIVGNTGKRMSSPEIAELAGKKHFNVMRDIKALIDQGAIGETNYGLTYYTTEQNKREPMYMLDFDAPMTLITGYDSKQRTIVCRKGCCRGS